MIRNQKKKSFLEIIFSQSNYYWQQIAMILILVISLSFLFPGGKTLLYSYQLNDVSKEEIVAPFNFPILKNSNELQSDLDEAITLEPFIFIRSNDAVAKQLQEIDTFFDLTEKIQRANIKLINSKNNLYRERFSENFNASRIAVEADSTSLEQLKNKMIEFFSFIDEDDKWNMILFGDLSSRNKIDLEKIENKIIKISRNRWAEGIYDIPISDILSKQVAMNILDGKANILVDPSDYNDLQAAWTKARVEITNEFTENEITQREIGYSLIVELMKPNLLFDRETTERRQQARLDRVPRNKGIILENERVVEANKRITEDDLEKLFSLSLAVDAQSASEDILQITLAYLGRIIVVGILVSLLFGFLFVYKKTIFENQKMVLFLCFIFLIEGVLAYLFTQKLALSEYLIPITVSAMVITIMFDGFVGLIATFSMIFLIGTQIGNNVEFMITSLFTSIMGIYTVRNLRRRSQLFTAIFVLIGCSTLAIIGQGLFKGYDWQIMSYDMMNLLLLSVLSPILTYGLIGILEVSFGITTNLTLIELLDFQQPLLKRLQQEANGTFNHCVVVGNLAEACADAIGANSLLCRVGAYYHDIGKMLRPEYYIENQYGGENKHDKLTPVMSAKIIKSHVSDGLLLAKEYSLPKIVSDFIPMHHGTSRVEYFYRQALEEDNNVDEEQFKYSGPKPNTKETGILMICEAIEAGIRSIKEPDLIKIEEMITKIINSRISSGQLSECPLTMDELTRIKGNMDGNSGLLSVLKGIYHIRIEYPEELENSKAAEK
ncbi:MAG: HDIG domain-containing metalloprotein [Candidatus Neomarinimicrobiota bacterium]|nr:HDIG domain-containing metalloprotein [Candidatus Neomarinimicrobiota bacterium]